LSIDWTDYDQLKATAKEATIYLKRGRRTRTIFTNWGKRAEAAQAKAGSLPG